MTTHEAIMSQDLKATRYVLSYLFRHFHLCSRKVLLTRFLSAPHRCGTSGRPGETVNAPFAFEPDFRIP